MLATDRDTDRPVLDAERVAGDVGRHDLQILRAGIVLDGFDERQLLLGDRAALAAEQIQRHAVRDRGADRPDRRAPPTGSRGCSRP